jgi:hypothetical protein
LKRQLVNGCQVAGRCGAARVFAHPSSSPSTPPTSSQRGTTSLSISQSSSFGFSTSSIRSTSPSSPTPTPTPTPSLIPTPIPSGRSTCCGGYEDFKQYEFQATPYTQFCDVDFPGGDLYPGDDPLSTGDLFTCTDCCARSENCVGVTYNEETDECFLKRQMKANSLTATQGYCAMVPYNPPTTQGLSQATPTPSAAPPALRVTTNGRCGSDVGLTCQGSTFGQCCSNTGYW